MNATGTTNHGDRAHAVLSPSGADRWLHCTPSARLGEKYPDEENDYAREGTLAHEIAERCLRYMTKQIDRDEYNAQMKPLTLHKLYYDGMVKDVEPYVHHVLEQIATDKNAELHIEGKYSYRQYVEDGEGLCDAAVIAKKILYITDLKFGKGIRVDAKDNSQLKLYGLGALIEFDLLHDIELVRLTIVQPRLDHVSVWDITPADLYKWAEEEVKPKAAIAFKGEGEHVTGDWCKFCKAKVFCPALKAEALVIAQADFALLEHELSNEEVIPEEALLIVYCASNRIADYLEAIKSFVYQKAMEGKKWPGFKLVDGSSKRKITDEKMATHKLIMKGYKFNDFQNTSLKGIGDLEKLLGKDVFSKLIGPYVDRPAAKQVLVPADDPRTEFNSANDFDEPTEDLSFLD